VFRTLAAAARAVAMRHRSALSDTGDVPCLYCTGSTSFCTPFSDSFLYEFRLHIVHSYALLREMSAPPLRRAGHAQRPTGDHRRGGDSQAALATCTGWAQEITAPDALWVGQRAGPDPPGGGPTAGGPPQHHGPLARALRSGGPGRLAGVVRAGRHALVAPARGAGRAGAGAPAARWRCLV
jgi:hypothetical protein